MSQSDAFELIKQAVQCAVRFIPPGRVSTPAEIGSALNVPARHVAFIISKFSDEQTGVLNAHRIVPKDGKFGLAAKWSARRASAIRSLRSEGTVVTDDGLVINFAQLFVKLPDTYVNTRWDEEAVLGLDCVFDV